MDATCFLGILILLYFVKPLLRLTRTQFRAALSGTGDRYSRFYTFTLDQAADVTVTLESDEDTYLYLLEGHGRSDTVLQEEDDIDYPSNTNSRLAETLQAGDYTIEATTYYADKSGEFTLTISGLDSTQ